MVKGTRKLSAYNVFMKEELKRVKKSNPKIGHQDAFKMVAKKSFRKSKCKIIKQCYQKSKTQEISQKKVDN